MPFFWGSTFVSSVTLECIGDDCGANGWDVFSSGQLIASVTCNGSGCFTIGCTITSYEACTVPEKSATGAVASSSLLAVMAFLWERRRVSPTIGSVRV